MLKYLLDTNNAIYVIKRRPIEVMGVFNQNASRIAISAITLSELLHGAEKSANVAQNLAVVEEFASLLEVLPYTTKASQHYGAIRSALEKVGRPIGVNDLHIAAHARSEGLTLVTSNLGEFERVPGLLKENWVGVARGAASSPKASRDSGQALAVVRASVSRIANALAGHRATPSAHSTPGRAGRSPCKANLGFRAAGTRRKPSPAASARTRPLNPGSRSDRHPGRPAPRCAAAVRAAPAPCSAARSRRARPKRSSLAHRSPRAPGRAAQALRRSARTRPSQLAFLHCLSVSMGEQNVKWLRARHLLPQLRCAAVGRQEPS